MGPAPRLAPACIRSRGSAACGGRAQHHECSRMCRVATISSKLLWTSASGSSITPNWRSSWLMTPVRGRSQHRRGPARWSRTQHHQRQDDDAPPFRRDARRIGDGITEQQRQQRHQQADFERQRKVRHRCPRSRSTIILQRKSVVINLLARRSQPTGSTDRSRITSSAGRRQRQHQARSRRWWSTEGLHGAAHGDPAMVGMRDARRAGLLPNLFLHEADPALFRGLARRRRPPGRRNQRLLSRILGRAW